MQRNSGSEPATGPSRLTLMLLAAAALGSGLLYGAMPSEGLQGYLRLFSLLPLQLAALLWVLPRLR